MRITRPRYWRVPLQIRRPIPAQIPIKQLGHGIFCCSTLVVWAPPPPRDKETPASKCAETRLRTSSSSKHDDTTQEYMEEIEYRIYFWAVYYFIEIARLVWRAKVHSEPSSACAYKYKETKERKTSWTQQQQQTAAPTPYQFDISRADASCAANNGVCAASQRDRSLLLDSI